MAAPPDPSPAEIRYLCGLLQRRWSDRERLLRAGVWTVPPYLQSPDDATWTPPECSMPQPERR